MASPPHCSLDWRVIVALSADKAQGLDSSEDVHGFAEALSVAPVTYSLRRGDRDFVVFCFARPEDAEAFCQTFGGERLPGTQPP